MNPRKLSLPARLTAWHVAALAGVFVLHAGATSAVTFFQLRAQLDQHAIEQLETIEGHLYFQPAGGLRLRSDYHDHPYDGIGEERFIEVRSEDGAVLYRNEQLGSRVLDGPVKPGEGVNTYSPRTVQWPGGPRLRLISRRHLTEGRPLLIRFAISEENLWQSFYRVMFVLLAGLPIALALAGFGGYFLSRKVLAPVRRMAARASEINAEQLNARLAVENPDDEIGVLAGAFNDTLARLETAFEHLRRFTSDAAHELRTPLTAIRSVGEVGLRKQGDSGHYREVISSMLEEANRLNRLVDGLLAVARADAAHVRLSPTTFPAIGLVREVAAFLEVLAEEKGQTLAVEGDETIQIEGDRSILRQVLINLLDNAIKYSPTGGRIVLRSIRGGKGNVVWEIEDSGPGIASEHQQRVFDRFYRVDQARSRQTGGAGLGLSFARWGAQAHGGRLELDSRPGAGCVFRLSAPARLS